jgi:hypothetical protein
VAYAASATGLPAGSTTLASIDAAGETQGAVSPSTVATTAARLDIVEKLAETAPRPMGTAPF